MYLGIDVGGTNLKYGVISENGEVISKNSEPTVAQLGFGIIVSRIKEIISLTAVEFPDLKSCGIGFPGVISPKGIIVVAPNLPGAENYPFLSELREAIAVPIFADNDANAAAIAELELGAGAGEAAFLYVTLGTGIGGAIIQNRKLFKGETGAAGEIGHTFIDYKKCLAAVNSFQAGTFEEAASRRAIIDRAKSILKHDNTESSLRGEFDVSDISEACSNRDEAAKKCLREIGQILGVGLASAMNLLDIGLVVIGGGISNSHDFMFETALDTIKKCALAHIASRAELRKAHFGADAGIIGAAMLCKQV